MSAPRSKTHSQGGHSVEAYKGYLIQPALMGDVFYVQKSGITIASCPTYEAAKAAIDEVTRCSGFIQGADIAVTRSVEQARAVIAQARGKER